MENLDITINGSQATYTMARTDGELGGTYTGTFVFKCYLSPLEQIQAGKEFRSLLGDLGQQANDTESNLAFALTQLKHRVIKSPPFWSSTLQDGPLAGNIPDLNILAIVLDASIRAEALFKEKIAKERDALLNKTIETGEKLLQEQQGE
jgi:hypothetical protein